MNADDERGKVLARLREPFAPENIGKLPKVTCWNCTQANKKDAGATCGQHGKQKCKVCGNYLTSAHTHIDYVGHAEVTDRLLDTDSEWNWEPLALDERGLPQLDDTGGLWIRLTVAGVTRLGYGDADGKRGTGAVKVAIGDALRNASMRFGVALNQWAKSDLHADEHNQEPPAGVNPDRPRLADDTDHVSQSQAAMMGTLFDERGIDEPAERQRIVSQIIGHAVTGILQLTPAEASAVIQALTNGELPVAGQLPPPSPLVPKADQKQHARMAILLREKRGITDDDQSRAAIATMVNRPLASRAELTTAEARSVIEKLDAEQQYIPLSVEDNPVREILAKLIADATTHAQLDEVGSDIVKELARGNLTPAEADVLRAAWKQCKAVLNGTAMAGAS